MLNDYVDGDINPAVCDEFEKHLTDCNPCQIVVDTIRKTITLYRGEEVYELPKDFSEKLHETLEEKWSREGPGAGDARGP